MTYVLKDIIKGGTGAIIDVPIIYKILNNPLIIAILLTLIILLITMFVYDNKKGVKNILKTIFYMFTFNFGILLLYNHVIDKEWKEKQISGNHRELLQETAEITGGTDYDRYEQLDNIQKSLEEDITEKEDNVQLIVNKNEDVPELLTDDTY